MEEAETDEEKEEIAALRLERMEVTCQFHGSQPIRFMVVHVFSFGLVFCRVVDVFF